MPPDRDLYKLAGLLCLAGPDEHERCLYAFIELFVGRGHRTKYWGKAIDKIPARAESVTRVRDCVQAFAKHCAPDRNRTIGEERIDLTRAVSVMVQIPDADAYVRWCANDGLTKGNAVFHPNTLKLARKRLRGIFGYDGQGSGTSETRLKTIE